MHLITYISDYKLEHGDIDIVLNNIVKVAQQENAKHDITGVLFFQDGKFMQVIEGPEAKLRQLMHNIEADPRHDDIEYVIDTKVDFRGFSKWNMDSFHLKRGQIFDADTLHALTEGFEKTLLPRADMLVFYYKSLMEEQQKGLKSRRCRGSKKYAGR